MQDIHKIQPREINLPIKHGFPIYTVSKGEASKKRNSCLNHPQLAKTNKTALYNE